MKASALTFGNENLKSSVATKTGDQSVIYEKKSLSLDKELRQAFRAPISQLQTLHEHHLTVIPNINRNGVLTNADDLENGVLLVSPLRRVQEQSAIITS